MTYKNWLNEWLEHYIKPVSKISVICQTFFSSFLKIFEIFFRKCRKHRKNTIKKPLSLLIITFPKKKVNRIA